MLYLGRRADSGDHINHCSEKDKISATRPPHSDSTTFLRYTNIVLIVHNDPTHKKLEKHSQNFGKMSDGNLTTIPNPYSTPDKVLEPLIGK